MTVTDANVAFVKRSGEVDSVLFANSVIVVRQNTSADARAGQYTVTRYWQNVFSGWIESEHMFDL